MISSKKFQFTKEDVLKILKAACWAAASALLAGLIYYIQSGDLPDWALAYAPALNLILYGAFRWLKDNR